MPGPMEAPVLSRPYALSKLGERPFRLEITAEPEERAQLARVLGLKSFDRLTADLTLTRTHGGRGVSVTGVVTADVVQACVVTLDPVPALVRENISRQFLEPALIEREREEEGELIIEAEADDLPEPLAGPSLDLGAIVEEQFILGLDPYPKKAGVVFAETEAGRALAAENPNPFAALAALKRDGPV